MKKILIVVALLVVAGASIPLWGSCDLKQRHCNVTCTIKHFNNDNKASGCRARCAMENASCHGEEAAQEFNDFMKGLKGE